MKHLLGPCALITLVFARSVYGQQHDPRSCLVYNEVNLMVAAIAATFENSVLGLALQTYRLYDTVRDHAVRLFDTLKGLGEHIVSELNRLTAGGSWYEEYILYEPLSWLVRRANSTLYTIGGDIARVGSAFQRNYIALTKRVFDGVALVVRDTIADIRQPNRTQVVLGDRAERGQCRYRYAHAISRVGMTHMHLHVMKCATAYGDGVLVEMGRIEKDVHALEHTVRRLLAAFEEESIEDIYKVQNVVSKVAHSYDNVSSNLRYSKPCNTASARRGAICSTETDRCWPILRHLARISPIAAKALRNECLRLSTMCDTRLANACNGNENTCAVAKLNTISGLLKTDVCGNTICRKISVSGSFNRVITQNNTTFKRYKKHMQHTYLRFIKQHAHINYIVAWLSEWRDRAPTSINVKQILV